MRTFTNVVLRVVVPVLGRLLAVAAGIALAAAAAPLESRSWEDRFVRPPADARILKIIHGWPDAPSAQDGLIERLRAQGFGGVVCNVSFDEYLRSDGKWAAFVRGVNSAKQAGFAQWLYDERGYPSGNAGGLTLPDHPEWEARGLLVSETSAVGGTPALLELPPGDPVLVRAYALEGGALDLNRSVDLGSRVRAGRLEWNAPEGTWKVLAITESRLFEGTHADGNLHAKLPYPNLLLAEPTARFVELTYGGYTRHLGADLGRFFEATFTDEPSLMSLFLKPMPYRPLPWSASFPAEFARRRGHPFELAQLPLLVAEAGSGTAKLRYDFWQTVGELVSENYFGQIQERCRRHGVASGGHLLAEEGLVGHVPLYGDFFRCVRRLDAPSIDCLTSVPAEVPWFIARLVASAAELERRPLVMSETSDHSQAYRPAGDGRPVRVVTEAEIRGTANRLIVAGVNVLTSYYRFTGLDDAALRRLNDEIGRACTAVRGGYQVADVAVLYPIESVWTRFVPSRHWTREASAAARIESLYRAVADGLFAGRRDFTYIDSRALAEAKVEADGLVHGPSRWRVVVLPGVDTLPLAAWERLAEFVRAGGVAIAVGALPRNSGAEFPSERVRAIAREVFGLAGIDEAAPGMKPNTNGGGGIFVPAGMAGVLPVVVDGVLEPDVKTGVARTPIRVTHRRVEGHEVYFLINDGPDAWTGRIDFAAAGGRERWDLATGRSESFPDDAPMTVSLEPYRATVVRFAQARPPRRLPLRENLLPEPSVRPVPAARPEVIGGEFVRPHIVADPLRSTGDRPVWRVDGTLTKGQVDTFLFAQLRFAPALDWSGADHLEIESWVPESQATPNQLLVILHEEGGGDFLVETGRSLAGPGHERTYLGLDRFQLAGWSKDADGRLDPRRIQEIRIGWGGYLGKAGEDIGFSVALPAVGSTSVAPPRGPDRRREEAR